MIGGGLNKQAFESLHHDMIKCDPLIFIHLRENHNSTNFFVTFDFLARKSNHIIALKFLEIKFHDIYPIPN